VILKIPSNRVVPEGAMGRDQENADDIDASIAA
jgi:hypothetical protein